MTTIWKFPIQPSEHQEIAMPRGARILHVEMQMEQPCLWAEVDPEAPPEPRVVGVFGTGHDLPDVRRRHIGTFQMLRGALVFHVYEFVKPAADPTLLGNQESIPGKSDD